MLIRLCEYLILVVFLWWVMFLILVITGWTGVIAFVFFVLYHIGSVRNDDK